MEIEQVIDELHSYRSSISKLLVSEILYSDFFLKEHDKLIKKTWQLKFYKNNYIYDYSTAQLIDIFKFLIKNNTMLFRDEWREIVINEIHTRLETKRIYKTVPSKINTENYE